MEPFDTRDPAYTERLAAAGSSGWKRWLHVQAPYRWNLRRLHPGKTLDVGCGIGRNLVNLRHGIGVDHNESSVKAARANGCQAFTPQEFATGEHGEEGTFDSILFAHVLEHMSQRDAATLIGEYLQYLRPGGRVVAITPQEAGYASDPTHVEFLDAGDVSGIFAEHGIATEKSYSFPFPRFVGRFFRHNEFVVVGRIPDV